MTIKRLTSTILIILACLTMTNTPADTLTTPTIAPAFQLSINTKNSQQIDLKASISPGYYLYKNQLHVKLIKPTTLFLKPIRLPTAEKKTFANGESLDVYQKDFSVPLILQQPADKKTITLIIQYQGCSNDGFCLPPQKVKTTFKLSAPYHATHLLSPLSNNASSSFTTLNQLATQLNQTHSIIALLTFFGLGVLLSLTPCVLPMIPVLSSIIIGQKKPTGLRSFTISLSYVIGMACTYALTGMLFGIIGSTLQSLMQKPMTLIIFSILFVIMGLSSLGLYNIKPPKLLNSIINSTSPHQHKKTLVSTFVMGVLSTLILSPCITPPLVAVLSYISHQGSLAFGGLALFFMGLGLGLPLLIVGSFGKKLLPKTGRWEEHIKKSIGFILLGLAIWILSRIIPPVASTVLFSLLLIIISCYMGAFKNARTVGGYIGKYLGILLFISAITFFSIHLYQNHTTFQNSQNSTQPKTGATHLREIKAFFDNPNTQKKPIILDFSAQWCITCVEFEKNTLKNANVKALLSHDMAYLKVDISKNTPYIQQIKNQYHIIAPPTLLFFDKNHQEITNARITGFVSTQEFIDIMNTILHPFVLLPPQNMDLIPPSLK